MVSQGHLIEARQQPTCIGHEDINLSKVLVDLFNYILDLRPVRYCCTC